MQLQYRGGTTFVNFPRNHSENGVRFVFAACEHKDFFCAHYLADAHRDRAFRDLVDTVEKAGIVAYGFFCEPYAVGDAVERRARLIKSDMSVAADAQNLNIDDGVLKQGGIPCTFFVDVFRRATGILTFFISTSIFENRLRVMKFT